MSDDSTHVGMDVHAGTIYIAMLLPDRAQALEWTSPNEKDATRRLTKKILRAAPGKVHACYEAGPTGYALQREMQAAGIHCDVIAPSLIPRKPGDRVKTDRRDARKLAELLRAGVLTAIQPPTPAAEAVRDLCRAREDAKQDLTRCRHRLGKFLLRRGLRWTAGRSAWGLKHFTWLRSLRLEHPADQAILEDYLLAIDQVAERVKSLEAKLEGFAEIEPYRTSVGVLRCFKGIATVTAMTLLTELHGFERFTHPRQLMSYLGLTPSESSSGDKTRRGNITKTGNAHVRRVLVESAWSYASRPTVGKTVTSRRQGQPAWAIGLADRAQQRLHRRFLRLTTRGKPRNKAMVAIARELVGFIWAALYRPIAMPAAG